MLKYEKQTQNNFYANKKDCFNAGNDGRAQCALLFSVAADETGEMKATAMEKSFIMNAANGGMTEVEAGKAAAQKGASDAVKDFGNRMMEAFQGE